MDALKTLLPLYDVEHLCNTRYQLTGFVRVKLVSRRSVGMTPRSLEVEIPGEGWFAGDTVIHRHRSSRWNNFVERVERRLIIANVVLSMISHPAPNGLKVELDAEADSDLSIYLATADYEPETTAMKTTGGTLLTTTAIHPGRNIVRFSVALDKDNIVAYPTNFKKRLEGPHGRGFNAYHFIHAKSLATLYKRTRRPILLEYCRKWSGYIDR